jgi:integrase
MRRSKRPDPTTIDEVLELPSGTHYYRDGLVLKIRARSDGRWEARDWYYRYKSPRTGKPTEHKLCSAYTFTAEEARHKIKHRGDDPVQAQRDAKARIKTFGEVTANWISDKNLVGGLLYTAELYLHQHCADLLDQHMATINHDRIFSTLHPLIQRAPDTAKRVLNMLHTIFEYAIGRGWYTASNPAKWEGLHETRWPKRPNGRHHPGLPYAEVPAFMSKLRLCHQDATAAVALEFTILTACRTNEVLQMKWSEINWDQKVWEQSKRIESNKKRYRVPLTDRMVQILRGQEKLFQGSEFVFNGYSDAALTRKAMLKFLRNMGIKDYDVHGFRSSFSTWAYEQAVFDPLLIELSLGHVWGSKTTRSYMRSDALERRRPLMVAWTNYCGLSWAHSVAKAI